MKTSYRICLADYETILPTMAELIGANYSEQEYSAIFLKPILQQQKWVLRGHFGSLSIDIEQYEGYLFSEFQADEPHFQQGKELLWRAYIEQGGNPNAQEKP